MVGNVWEWVGDRVEQGVIDNVSLAASGYVADVSTDGYPVSVTTTPQAVFNNDYVWTEPTGVRSIMRGGYHGSGDEGGVYAFHAATAPQFSSGSIGFRCISLLGS
jgi:formylglycine-generating enzyme required for sulfatase activity